MLCFSNSYVQRLTNRRLLLATGVIISLLACSLFIDQFLLCFSVVVGFLFLLLLSFVLSMGFLCFSVNYGNRRQKIMGERRNDDILIQLGLSEDYISNLASSAADEVLLAEFDQNNRVISYVGDISYFWGSTINACDFMKRSRNKIELILLDGKVVLKKKYKSIKSLMAETISLYVLKDVRNVPKLQSLNFFRLTSYQSFIMGKNIGSELVLHGTSVSEQYQIDVYYPGPGKWNPRDLPSRVNHVRNCIRKEMNETFSSDLFRLIDLIHECGVIINDLKYGNIIKNSNVPYLIDFDRSNFFYFKNARYLKKKNAERDKFNYLFSVNIPIESVSIES